MSIFNSMQCTLGLFQEKINLQIFGIKTSHNSGQFSFESFPSFYSSFQWENDLFNQTFLIFFSFKFYLVQQLLSYSIQLCSIFPILFSLVASFLFYLAWQNLSYYIYLSRFFFYSSSAESLLSQLSRIFPILAQQNLSYSLVLSDNINIMKTTFDFNFDSYQAFKQDEYTKTWNKKRSCKIFVCL